MDPKQVRPAAKVEIRRSDLRQKVRSDVRKKSAIVLQFSSVSGSATQSGFYKGKKYLSTTFEKVGLKPEIVGKLKICVAAEVRKTRMNKSKKRRKNLSGS